MLPFADFIGFSDFKNKKVDLFGGKMKKFSKVNKSALFLVLIFIIFIGVGLFLFFSLNVDPVDETLRNEPIMKVLFVIHDDENKCLATDVLLYNTKSQKSSLFDIVGNTGSIFNSIQRVDRIDAVYAEKGIEVYKSEIENLINQEIPFTIEISLEQLGVLTDLLGGLKVFVPSPVDYTSEDGKRWLLPSGAVSLDGDKIQTFVEYFLPGENFNDTEDRLQNTLIALLTGIKDNKNTIFLKSNFPFFAQQFKANVDNAGLKKILMNLSNIETERLSPTAITGNYRVVDGQTLLFPYYNGQLIKEVIAQSITSLMNDESVMQNGVYVLEILNGTSKPGLAKNTSFLMKSVGYDVLEYGNADRTDYEHTLIINHNANSQAVNALADFIRCKNIRNEEYNPNDFYNSDVARADFTIILGDDFDGRRVVGGYEPPPQELEQEDFENLENLSSE